MRRTASLATLACLTLLACTSRGPTPAPKAPAPAASAARVAPTPRDARPDPLAELRARAPLHGEPVRLGKAGRGGRTEDASGPWLAFLGSAEAAVSAWLVTTDAGGKPFFAPVESWPAGVKVLGAVVRDGTVHVLLETVALLDQPAGLRGVWTETFAGKPHPAVPPLAFAGVKDLADLEKRVDALTPAQAPPEGTDEAMLETLRAAAQSEGALSRALAPQGADIYDVWQSTFLEPVEKVAPARLSSSSRVQDLLGIVKDAVEAERCADGACLATNDDVEAQISMTDLGTRWVVRAFERDAARVKRASRGAPRAVPASPTTTATEQALRLHVRTTKKVLGEAPLGAGGGDPGATIGVALTDLQFDGPAVVLREAGFSRVFPIESMGVAASKLKDAVFEARFADVDGDGRTDVVLRVSGFAEGGEPASLARAFLSPPATVQARRAEPDEASDLALAFAPSADAAVAAALAVPTRGVTTAEACKLLSGAATLPTFRKIASPDVRVLTFEDAALPSFRARVVPETMLRAEDVRPVGARCADLDCPAGRPVCTLGHGHAPTEVYWFTWVGGQLRLAGAGFAASLQ